MNRIGSKGEKKRRKWKRKKVSLVGIRGLKLYVLKLVLTVLTITPRFLPSFPIHRFANNTSPPHASPATPTTSTLTPLDPFRGYPIIKSLTISTSAHSVSCSRISRRRNRVAMVRYSSEYARLHCNKKLVGRFLGEKRKMIDSAQGGGGKYFKPMQFLEPLLKGLKYFS